MGQSDLEFVETLLTATPYIFFIQTKIDQYDRVHWEHVQQRNQDILSERFAPRRRDRRVWPVSSPHLLQAAQTGHDEYVTKSHHQDMSVALHAFLWRVTGWNRPAEAITVAQHYHALSRQTLVGRLATLTEASKEPRASLQQAAVERQQQFDAAWGQAGTKRQEIMTRLQKVMTIGRRNFEVALQSDGDIAHAMQRQTDGLSVVDQYFKALGGFITERLEALVTQKSSEARAQVARLAADAPLDDEQRHVKAQQLRQRLADWDALSATIQSITARLEALEHSAERTAS